ncbi:MAG: fumarylacetoacetate hydrolase family protein, partial [Elusimicrobia bacterium]|nr:fumarylacetoacetate hydrolase family protein [Elusimicrobiota bacterium]
MIFCRYISREISHPEPQFGIVENHQVIPIAPNPFIAYETVGEPEPLSSVQLLSPVIPSKVVAVGVNYRSHAQEMNHPIPEEPLLFLKPPSSVIGPEETILYPKMSQRVDYEAELAVILKKRAKNIPIEEAKDCILGYSCFNDVTARDLQKKDVQWSRSKGFDTFSALGPWIVSDLDPSDLSVESYLNGELKQNGRTSDMIFSVPALISFISRVMTLEPGDVVTTGTPPGVGP